MGMMEARQGAGGIGKLAQDKIDQIEPIGIANIEFNREEIHIRTLTQIKR